MPASHFGGFLKIDTAAVVHVGPFVDATDFVTPETGLTLGAADYAEALKAGASAVTDISGLTFTAITGANGMYTLALTASETDTVGPLTIYIADTNVCVPVAMTFIVLPANVYDSFVAGSDYMQTDVTQINGNASSGFLSGTDHIKADVTKVSGDSTAADNLEASLEGLVEGTVQTGSTTTSVTTNLTESTNDHYNGRRIVFRSGNLAGQGAEITDYSGSSKALTVSTLTEAPSNGDTFVIV